MKKILLLLCFCAPLSLCAQSSFYLGSNAHNYTKNAQDYQIGLNWGLNFEAVSNVNISFGMAHMRSKFEDLDIEVNNSLTFLDLESNYNFKGLKGGLFLSQMISSQQTTKRFGAIYNTPEPDYIKTQYGAVLRYGQTLGSFTFELFGKYHFGKIVDQSKDKLYQFGLNIYVPI